MDAAFFPTAIKDTHVFVPVEMDEGEETRRLRQDLGAGESLHWRDKKCKKRDLEQH